MFRTSLNTDVIILAEKKCIFKVQLQVLHKADTPEIELTNQDSAGEKYCPDVNCIVNRKGIEVREQFFWRCIYYWLKGINNSKSHMSRRYNLGYSEQNMLFLDRQIIRRILELSIRWSNLAMSLFYAISFDGKDYYRVVSVGQLGFDCCS